MTGPKQSISNFASGLKNRNENNLNNKGDGRGLNYYIGGENMHQ